MKRHKLTENFYLDEFVCPEIYSLGYDRSIQQLDMRIVLAVQFIRENIGVPVHLNNWWNGGKLDERGLRTMTTRTGAKMSQHKYGRAADISADGLTPAQLLTFIKEHESMFIENGWITTYENIEFTKTWLHIDCRNTLKDSFLQVNP